MEGTGLCVRDSQALDTLLGVYRRSVSELATIGLLLLREHLLSLECMSQWTKDQSRDALIFEVVVSPPVTSPPIPRDADSHSYTPTRATSDPTHPASLLQSPIPGAAGGRVHRSCVFDEISLQDTLVLHREGGEEERGRRRTWLNTSLLRWNRLLVPPLQILMLVVGTRYMYVYVCICICICMYI